MVLETRDNEASAQDRHAAFPAKAARIPGPNSQFRRFPPQQ